VRFEACPVTSVPAVPYAEDLERHHFFVTSRLLRLNAERLGALRRGNLRTLAALIRFGSGSSTPNVRATTTAAFNAADRVAERLLFGVRPALLQAWVEGDDPDILTALLHGATSDELRGVQFQRQPQDRLSQEPQEGFLIQSESPDEITTLFERVRNLPRVGQLARFLHMGKIIGRAEASGQ
jgi:hypothetical protein